MPDQARSVTIFRISARRVFVMDDYRRLRQRVFDAENSGQLFVVDFDFMHRPFGDFFINSRHGGDDVAHVAHLFQCDDGLVLDVRPIVRRADI